MYSSIGIPSKFEGETGVAGSIDFGAVGLSEIITYAINLFFLLNLTLCFLITIWYGISWIMAGGDINLTKKAQLGLVYAIVGLVVSILAIMVVGTAGQAFNLNLGLPD